MLRVVHASGRFSATPSQLALALDNYSAQADVITLTEVAKFGATLGQWARSRGWFLYHPDRPGMAECAILSNRQFDRTASHRLTDLRLKVGRTTPMYLITARVKGGPWFGVWHSPAHNEGLKPGLWPTRVYLSALRGLRHARMRMHGGGVVLAADWNLDLRRTAVRAQLAKPYPHMRWAWAPGQKSTEGGRVIDGVLTNLRVLSPARTLPAVPGFDHRAIIVTLEENR